MSEDLTSSLPTYKFQLEQVEAALTLDPENEELQKLWCDLKEVLNLTENLINKDDPSSTETDVAHTSTEKIGKKWKVGDMCQALFAENGQWYDAVIEAITDDGMAAITYPQYGNSDVCKLVNLREKVEKSSFSPSSSKMEGGESSRKRQQELRAIAKKKKQKKFERLKQIEEAHEAEKQKWKSFSSKSKKMRGVNRKSIFATPDAVNGRVGIGTCGIGGKPMTDFSHAEKWRKGT